MLTLHRRHLAACEHRARGWNYTLCDCPVWADGLLNGERVTKSLQTRDWERALSKLAGLSRGVDVGIELHPGRTVGHAVAAYLAECEDRNLRPSTVRSRRRCLDYLTDSLGARNIAGVQLDELKRHLSTRALGPRTMRKEIEYLRFLWSWCVDNDWTTINPARKLRPPKTDDVPTMPFTEDEVRRLLGACDRLQPMCKADRRYVRQRARALVLVLLYSGLRNGDVAQLRRDALDSSGHLTLRAMKTGVRLKVLLHDTAAAALRGLPAPEGNPTYFFWSGRGDPTRNCAKSLGRTISRVGAIAEVSNAHPHRFRDTFAVELLTRGVDIRTVQLLLGHTSLKTTEKHYAPFVAAHQALLDSAAARLDFTTTAPARPLLIHTNHK